MSRYVCQRKLISHGVGCDVGFCKGSCVNIDCVSVFLSLATFTLTIGAIANVEALYQR